MTNKTLLFGFSENEHRTMMTLGFCYIKETQLANKQKSALQIFSLFIGDDIPLISGNND